MRTAHQVEKWATTKMLVVDVNVDAHAQPSITRSETVHSHADAGLRASAPHSGSMILNGGPARPHAQAGDSKLR